jgi:hypothetical protein
MPQQQLYLELGGDFVLNSNGGLQWASGWDVIRQNFSRFVFTCAARLLNGVPYAADWIFYPDFGLSANALIGQNFTPDFISKLQQAVYQGALQASTGNSSVPPVVTVTQGNNPQQINVQVVITPNNGQQQTINVSLP